MRRITTILILAGAFVSHGAPNLMFSSLIGGNLGYLKTEFPEAYNFDEMRVSPNVSLGTRLELRVNDYLGASLGIVHEKRGATLEGQLQGGALVLIEGEYAFSYEFLQLPAQVRASLPLLIPASIFVSAGPELGVRLRAIHQVNAPSWNIRDAYINIDSLTSRIDFGLGAAAGCEFEIGRATRISLFGGYFLGLLDMYENDEIPENDYDLFTRSVRFGLVLSAGFGG